MLCSGPLTLRAQGQVALELLSRESLYTALALLEDLHRLVQEKASLQAKAEQQHHQVSWATARKRGKARFKCLGIQLPAVPVYNIVVMQLVQSGYYCPCAFLFLFSQFLFVEIASNVTLD